MHGSVNDKESGLINDQEKLILFYSVALLNWEDNFYIKTMFDFLFTNQNI